MLTQGELARARLAIARCREAVEFSRTFEPHTAEWCYYLARAHGAALIARQILYPRRRRRLQ